ncbi:DUF1178 domain-containing protein [Kaistia algarum]|uniref:DUF1178 family protein n=1 Tax=Kaistia algarum TaxID=2083279 RepID=UPI000CE88A6D|nr:DUF1178 family protein [Kaistia algarum]MCX5514489.1 DUF1178 family protein [Kaistia algarum]PPE79216.1 DUF1178 domain-containing protein [Kaistia algarum]
MIRYDLVCSCGHDFDSWFRDASAFDKAAAAKAVTCPVCGGGDIRKALMAPSLSTSRKREAAALKVAAPDPRQLAMREMLKQVREHVEANADYVGNRFAEEARKIHYEEVEPRGIYGEASPEDARALIDEGIEFHPLPALPEEGN